MQVKGLYSAFNYRLFSQDRRDRGNELVTKLCPKKAFSCLFLSKSTCVNLMENTVNQLVCTDLHRFAFKY